MVGLLIRARKKELLTFDGEMLYQGKDDEQWIALTRSINSIREYFGRDGDIPGGGPCQGRQKLLLEDTNSNSELDISVAPRENVESITERLTNSDNGEEPGLPKEKTKNRLLNQSLRNSFRKKLFKIYNLWIFVISILEILRKKIYLDFCF